MEWISSVLHPDAETRWSLRRMRGRGRELSRNSPHARRFLNLLRVNVVGPVGPKLQAQVRGAGGDFDRDTNDRIEKAWRRWSRSRVTVDRRLSFVALQHVLIKALATDGEVFVRKFLNFPNEFGFALQVIDADQIDETFNRERGRDTNEVRLGVEIDRLGAPVAYWVDDYPPSPSAVPRNRHRVPADQIIHLYASERANQTRGVTWFHPVMTGIKMLDGYTEAELVAARTAAAKMGFFQSTEGAIAGEVGGDSNEPITMDANPGTLEQLPAGWEFKEWDPTHPTTAFPDFVKAVLHEISSGLDVSYTALSGDLEGVSFSSIRSGTLVERDTWRVLQEWWINELLEPLYREWLNMALLTGSLSLGSFDARRFQDVRWTPRGWGWVDPLKDSQAGALAIGQGLNSRKRILSEQGLDFEEVLEELAEENKLAASHGVQLAGPPEKVESTKDDKDDDDPPPASKNGKRRSGLPGSRSFASLS